MSESLHTIKPVHKSHPKNDRIWTDGCLKKDLYETTLAFPCSNVIPLKCFFLTAIVLINHDLPYLI